MADRSFARERQQRPNLRILQRGGQSDAQAVFCRCQRDVEASAFAARTTLASATGPIGSCFERGSRQRVDRTSSPIFSTQQQHQRIRFSRLGSPLQTRSLSRSYRSPASDLVRRSGLSVSESTRNVSARASPSRSTSCKTPDYDPERGRFRWTLRL